MRPTDDELSQLIEDANERAHKGRIERLRVLLTQEDLEPAPVDALSNEYYEEARLCWYMGAFVATIIMSQLAFEELIRAHYREEKGVEGKLNRQKKIDRAGFADLIRQAKKDGWLSSEEAAALDKLRGIRNPYVHSKDISKNRDMSTESFFIQTIKISAPELVEKSVYMEALQAVELLTTTYRMISRRFWGLE